MRFNTVGVAGAALISLACLVRVAGDQSAATQEEKSFKGSITAVNEKDRSISVKGVLFTRTFNATDTCKLSFESKPGGTWADLHPAQRVEVRYVNAQGVRIASDISQKDIVFKGYITAIDPAKRTLAVKHGLYVRNFALTEDCMVRIKDDKKGSLDGLKIGHTVHVAYEKEGAALKAYRIEQMNPTFVGTISAIDSSSRTVKAKDFLNEKRFNLVDGCKIVIGGKPDGNLSDLRIGDRVALCYEDVNGILVANRIGREPASPDAKGTLGAKANDQ